MPLFEAHCLNSGLYLVIYGNLLYVRNVTWPPPPCSPANYPIKYLRGNKSHICKVCRTLLCPTPPESWKKASHGNVTVWRHFQGTSKPDCCRSEAGSEATWLEVVGRVEKWKTEDGWHWRWIWGNHLNNTQLQHFTEKLFWRVPLLMFPVSSVRRRGSVLYKIEIYLKFGHYQSNWIHLNSRAGKIYMTIKSELSQY